MPFASLSRGFGIASKWSVFPTICRPATAGKLSATRQFTPRRLTAVRVAAAKSSYGIDDGDSFYTYVIPGLEVALRSSCDAVSGNINPTQVPYLQENLLPWLVDDVMQLHCNLKYGGWIEKLCKAYVQYIIKSLDLGGKWSSEEIEIFKTAALEHDAGFSNLIWMINFIGLREYIKKYGEVPSVRDDVFSGWIAHQRVYVKAHHLGEYVAQDTSLWRVKLLASFKDWECFTVDSKLDRKWLPALQKSLFHDLIIRKKALGSQNDLKDEILLKHLCREYIARILRTPAAIEYMASQEREALERVSNGTKTALFDDLVWLVTYTALMVYWEHHKSLPDPSHPYLGNWMEAQRQSYKVKWNDRNAMWKIAPWRLAVLGAWRKWQWNDPNL